jgi:hypothetical protein
VTSVLALAALLLAAGAGDEAASAADPNGPSCALSGEVLQAYGIGTPWAELARMAQDVGAAPLRPDLFQRPGDRATPLCAVGPALPLGRKVAAQAPGTLSLDWVPAMLSVYANTGYPSGANDGAVWQGKGVSAQLGVGLQFQWGILSAAFVPGAAWQQNAAFPTLPTGLPGNLAWSNPYYGTSLDVPQRFGDASFWTLTPGQSYVQLAYAGVGIGVSTENLWWGPGMRNTLLMSNNADGFPHAYLGTVRPVDIWVGNLEADVWLGSLGRSDYFYTQDRAWLFAFTADLELRWVRGLYVGFVFVNVMANLCRSCEQYSNQMIGFYGRWVFPPAGLEVYGEWTKDDGWAEYGDLMRELDHAAGYTLGLQKVFLGSDYWVRLIGEITDDNVPRPSRDWRPNPTSYYTHGGNTGYAGGLHPVPGRGRPHPVRMVRGLARAHPPERRLLHDRAARRRQGGERRRDRGRTALREVSGGLRPGGPGGAPAQGGARRAARGHQPERDAPAHLVAGQAARRDPLVLQATAVRLLLEAVGDEEVVDRVRLGPVAAHHLEEVTLLAVLLRIERGLDEGHVAHVEDDLAQDVLAADDLHRGAALRPLLEVPVEVLVVVEPGLRGARSQDAVGVVLQPLPEALEGKGGAGLNGDGGHGAVYIAGRPPVGATTPRRGED